MQTTDLQSDTAKRVYIALCAKRDSRLAFFTVFRYFKQLRSRPSDIPPDGAGEIGGALELQEYG
jgi:hypothetical protein